MTESSTSASYSYLFEQGGADRRWGVVVALAITLLLHLAFVLVVPASLWMRPQTVNDTREEAVEVELVVPEELDPELLRFVEANPDAPENEPDRTDQYSFRSTQAANEVPNEELLEAPNVEGEEPDSQKIIQGDLTQAPLAPPAPSAEATPGEGPGNEGGKLGQTAQQAIAPAQPMPAPDFIEQEAVDEEGIGSSLDLTGEAQEVFENQQEEAPINVTRRPEETLPEPVATPGDGAGGSPEAKPTPRARPRLAPELLTGPLMKSRGSAANRGSLSIDATFSEFGEYQQQFYAALQLGWYQEIDFFQPIDTASNVTVRFTMYSDGRIEGVKTVQTNASEIATVICETAITKRSPFRAWTQEMIEVFGDQRIMTVRFRYR